MKTEKIFSYIEENEENILDAYFNDYSIKIANLARKELNRKFKEFINPKQENIVDEDINEAVGWFVNCMEEEILDAYFEKNEETLKKGKLPKTHSIDYINKKLTINIRILKE